MTSCLRSNLRGTLLRFTAVLLCLTLSVAFGPTATAQKAKDAKEATPSAKKSTAKSKTKSTKKQTVEYSSPVTKKLKRKEYGLHFVFRPNPKKRLVHVEVHLRHDRHLRSVSFKHDSLRHLNFKARGKVQRYKSTVRWTPSRGTDVLSYDVKVRHKRNEQGYDAYIGDHWAIFRGEDLVPGTTTRSRKGAYSHTTFEVELPKGWTGMDSGWPRGQGKYSRVDNPERQFDRPLGWIIAGKIGSRRDYLDETQIAVAAPLGGAMQRMNTLALINFVWPEVQSAFQTLPEKILILGAHDPMWRGGLSSPNSFFMHTDRPLISENGTSTLLHELVHVISRVRGGSQSDWIAEGLAEFYSIELMRRAGAMNADRHAKVLQKLKDWSADVKTLRGPNSSGKTTARAVLLLNKLDREIRKASDGKRNIDDLTRILIQKRRITNKRIQLLAEEVLGRPSKTLDSSLINYKR